MMRTRRYAFALPAGGRIECVIHTDDGADDREVIAEWFRITAGNENRLSAKCSVVEVRHA